MFETVEEVQVEEVVRFIPVVALIVFVAAGLFSGSWDSSDTVGTVIIGLVCMAVFGIARARKDGTGQ